MNGKGKGKGLKMNGKWKGIGNRTEMNDNREREWENRIEWKWEGMGVWIAFVLNCTVDCMSGELCGLWAAVYRSVYWERLMNHYVQMFSPSPVHDCSWGQWLRVVAVLVTQFCLSKHPVICKRQYVRVDTEAVQLLTIVTALHLHEAINVVDVTCDNNNTP